MKVVGYVGSRSAFSKSICLGEKLKTMLREKNIEMELYTARNNVSELACCDKFNKIIMCQN